MPIKKKKSKINSLTLRRAWITHYKKVRDDTYSPYMAPALEQKMLKSCIEDYGEYAVALAIEKGIENNEYSIKSFCDSIDGYILYEENHRVVYLVEKYGGRVQKDLLNELEQLEDVWYPNNNTKEKSAEIRETLEEWATEAEEDI